MATDQGHRCCRSLPSGNIDRMAPAWGELSERIGGFPDVAGQGRVKDSRPPSPEKHGYGHGQRLAEAHPAVMIVGLVRT